METIKLINGLFTPEEAKEVLLDMINKKINFHNLRNFSSQVHFDHADAESVERIKELQGAKARFLALMEEAKAEQQGLVIAATVHMALEPKEQAQDLLSQMEAH
jgi:hypothetical protein